MVKNGRMSININERGALMEELTNCEKMVMYCMWKYTRPVTVAELRKDLKRYFGKSYERSTVCTFIKHLKDKGYVSTYEEKHKNMCFSMVDRSAFVDEEMEQFKKMWYSGSVSDMVAALCRKESMTKDELDKVRRILDELD